MGWPGHSALKLEARRQGQAVNTFGIGIKRLGHPVCRLE
jgi:hypothetical protein